MQATTVRCGCRMQNLISYRKAIHSCWTPQGWLMVSLLTKLFILLTAIQRLHKIYFGNLNRHSLLWPLAIIFYKSHKVYSWLEATTGLSGSPNTDLNIFNFVDTQILHKIYYSASGRHSSLWTTREEWFQSEMSFSDGICLYIILVMIHMSFYVNKH